MAKSILECATAGCVECRELVKRALDAVKPYDAGPIRLHGPTRHGAGPPDVSAELAAFYRVRETEGRALDAVIVRQDAVIVRQADAIRAAGAALIAIAEWDKRLDRLPDTTADLVIKALAAIDKAVSS